MELIEGEKDLCVITDCRMFDSQYNVAMRKVDVILSKDNEALVCLVRLQLVYCVQFLSTVRLIETQRELRGRTNCMISTESLPYKRRLGLFS